MCFNAALLQSAEIIKELYAAGFAKWFTFHGEKYPYHIALPGKRPFLLAGVWDRWKDPQSESESETFSVITVTAQGLPAQIHNTKLRMPLILGRNSGNYWLDPALSFSECSQRINPLYKSLEAWPVAKELFSRGTLRNRSDIQNPFHYSPLPALEMNK